MLWFRNLYALTIVNLHTTLRLTEMAESKIYAVRVSPRGAVILEKAIAESGLTQARFFRLALEGLVSAGGISAASFEHGRARGHADVGLLMAKYADQISATAARLVAEPDEPALVAAEGSDDDVG